MFFSSSFFIGLVFFNWSLRESKSPPIFWTPLGILAYLNDAVVWMVAILPLISNSSKEGGDSRPLGTVPSASIGITITMFHNF